MASSIKSRFILTGPPGIGKTTIVKLVSEKLNTTKIPIYGFYTEEVRHNRNRVGFDVVCLNGHRGRLARSDGPETIHKVGKYSVLIKEFEDVAIPELKKEFPTNKNVLIVDEIGKMEMFSGIFIKTVQEAFKKPCVIIATIPIQKGRPILLVESIRNDANNKVFEVTMKNRDKLPQEIFEDIQKQLLTIIQ